MNNNVFDKMKDILKQILSQPVKLVTKKVRLFALGRGRFYCPVCEMGCRKFFEFGINPCLKAVLPWFARMR
jgi:hypothetical protein